jgi:hypothetical protein
MGYLAELAVKYGSDRWGHHYYCEFYERYFAEHREDALTILELGIGAYEKTNEGGAGLKMWYDYFQNATILGVDVYPKSFLNNDRITTFVCSQEDENGLRNIFEEHGYPDIIIDDASHVNNKTIRSFEILFPMLEESGIYCVEDLHSSYWDKHGFGGNPNPNDYQAPTAINYFKRLVDDINRAEIHNFRMSHPFKEDIESVHFYPKQVFVIKK